MIQISLNDTSHEFDKSNLVTQRGKGGTFDTYKCKHCGLEGKRYGLSELITVKKAKNCTRIVKPQSINESNELGKVKIQRIDPSWGLKSGDVVERVPCPESEKEKYNNQVWVFSPARNEPMLLLSGEYEEIE